MPGSAALFARYRNRVFVETGTYQCEGIEHALAAGFERVISIELDRVLHANAAARYAGRPAGHGGRGRVTLLHGPSEHLLWEAIKDLREPVTFWLDAHYSGEGTARGDSLSPILSELAAIGRHPVRTHTILIDDRRDFGTANFDFTTEDEIRSAIRAINPGYGFACEDGHVAKDILAATVPVGRAASRGEPVDALMRS